jgi:hypothetical protein
MIVQSSVQSGGACRADDLHQLVVSRVATDGDFVTLPVKVNDEWLTFAVDTGSPTTTLDRRFRDRLVRASVEQRSKAVAYNDEPDLYLPPRMVVAGTEVGAIPFSSDCAVSCRDLSTVRAASNSPIQGVLCMDFLESYALELNLNGGTLKLLDSASLTPNPRAAKIDMEIHWRKPCVQLKCHDLNFWGLIDTGALLSLSLQTDDQDAYAYLSSQHQIRPVTFQIERDGKLETRIASEGWLKELRLGPFRHNDLFVDQHPVSLIGLYYWRRYSCTFDFPGRSIYLEKNEFFDEPDNSDHAGIYFAQVARGFPKRVSAVAQDSLGARLGVRRGDYLLLIDGKPATPESLHNIGRQLTFRPTRDMELVFSRYGEEFRVVIPPSSK